VGRLQGHDRALLVAGDELPLQIRLADPALLTSEETAIKGTLFERIEIDIKGNYEVFMITAKKKSTAVKWDATMETKGMAPDLTGVHLKGAYLTSQACIS
jgi:hypothetical protein